MASTGNLLLQSWCCTSVRTNAITALFCQEENKKARRESLPRELVLWDVVGPRAPGQAASLSWAGHCRQAGLATPPAPELCVSSLPFSSEAGMEKVPTSSPHRRAGGAGRSSPSSLRAQLYLEANCKHKSDGELLLPLPINYPAAWDEHGWAPRHLPPLLRLRGQHRHPREEMPSQLLPSQPLRGSPSAAPGPHPAPLAVPSLQERRWLPWVPPAPRILPSERAALIENRGRLCSSTFTGQGTAGARSAAPLRLPGPKTSPQPGGTHSILAADVLGSRVICPRHHLAQQRGPS